MKKLSTSKLLILFLFLNCTLVEIFACWSVAEMLTISAANGVSIDFSPLVTLVGTVVSEILGYGIYSLKAAKENTKGGVVYDLALRKQEEEESNGNDDMQCSN